jgi:hypothetical protein
MSKRKSSTPLFSFGSETSPEIKSVFETTTSESSAPTFGTYTFSNCENTFITDDELRDITSLGAFYKKYTTSIVEAGISTVNKLASVHSKYKKLKTAHLSLHVENDILTKKYDDLIKKYIELNEKNKELEKKR